MKAKDISIVVCFLAIVVLCCFLGYRLRQQREFWRQEARFRISLNDGLYHAADRGDFQKVRSGLDAMLLEDVLVYQQQFGEDVGTNAFTRHFEDSKVIVKHIESQLVPISSIFNTNVTNTTKPN